MKLPPARHDDLSTGRLRTLLERFVRPELDRRPPTGAMARYVGAQHDVAALADCICFQMIDRFSLRDPDPADVTSAQLASLARVRAFAIPILVGSEVTAVAEDAFPAALEHHLQTVIAGVPWTVGPEAQMPLRKYLFFEAVIAAPVDDTTRMPMALQLYGEVVALDGIRRDTVEGKGLEETFFSRATRHLEAGAPLALLASPFTVKIEVATYANIQHPDVGMPFAG